MKTTHSKKLLSYILSAILLMAAFGAAGCGKKAQETPDKAETGSNSNAESNIVGEGNTKFLFTVTDKDGVETEFEVHTDQETVGGALEEAGLISGEESEYGLYVTTVNGIKLDFDEDGMYWAFYINDEYAQTGVDSTAITEGDSYSFRAE